MIKRSTLNEVIELQRMLLAKADVGHPRSILPCIDLNLQNFALIISGIRRCGKSTLVHQLIEQTSENYFFLNFDTAKLYTFQLDDFKLLDELDALKECKLLFFDEIQVVKGWEWYVRQKLDEGYRVIITGSNASLLSKELGTHLTGRHITKELFPFSYSEYYSYLQYKPNAESLTKYMEMGGFPAFLNTRNIELHTTLLDDIIYRDIAVRYNIRDVQSLKHLVLFLAANIGNLISATKLRHIIGVKSTATLLEYLSFFEQAYLIQLIPKFSFSYKAQLVNPRKLYFIDSGLQQAITSTFNKDNGRKLENIVFWELRRLQKKIFYYNENGFECDFVICNNNQAEQVMQVCFELNADNEKRELNGISDAMHYFNLQTGTILTFNQKDTIIHNNKSIEIIPFYEYFTQISNS